jgi:hypothetical protein
MENTSSQAEVASTIEDVKQGLASLGASPRVNTIHYELRFDSNGRDAAFIEVVLDDEPSGALYPWKTLQPIHDLIWQQFAAHKLTQWPYVNFRQVSETEEHDSEPEARAG